MAAMKTLVNVAADCGTPNNSNNDTAAPFAMKKSLSDNACSNNFVVSIFGVIELVVVIGCDVLVVSTSFISPCCRSCSCSFCSMNGNDATVVVVTSLMKDPSTVVVRIKLTNKEKKAPMTPPIDSPNAIANKSVDEVGIDASTTLVGMSSNDDENPNMKMIPSPKKYPASIFPLL